jgi:ribokinase
MNKDGVLVVGSANMDLVITADRFPKPGETIFGKNFRMFPGGKGANQAVGCAKLGCRTYFTGKFGKDDFHARLHQSMEKDGVNLDHVFTDENESTGTALITVDNSGQNEIVVISGSNMKLSPEDIESKTGLFAVVNIVLVQLEIPLTTVIKTAELAKANGCIFILNPAPARKLPEELMSMVDYLTPNETELELLSGLKVTDEVSALKAARELIGKGVKNIIVTLGSKGALLVTGVSSRIFEPVKVNPVDTTAAGDSFNGALAYSLNAGNDIEGAIAFANKAAAISVTRLGAQNSMPFIHEIDELVTINSLQG